MTASRLKHSFCFILFVLALSAPRLSALASCEGVDGGVVSTVWHSSEHDSYVIETQDAPAENQDFRSYFIQEKNIRLPLASAFYIIWPNTPSDGSPMDRYRGKGEISFTFPAKEDSDPASPPSAIFLRTLLASQKIPSSKIIDPPSETKAAYQALIQSVENIIEHSGGYARLSHLPSCPYRVIPQYTWAETRVYRLFFEPTYLWMRRNAAGYVVDIGPLPETFPGDERSQTTITPEGKCWGFMNQSPLVVAFHWDWECQGAGDLVFTTEQLGAKKNEFSLPF